MHYKFLNIKVIKTNLPPEEMHHLPALTNVILDQISSGNATWDEIHGFLDWFFNLPKPNRQALLDDFEPKKGSVLRCLSQEKNLVLSPVSGTQEIAEAYSLFAHIDDDFGLYNVEKGSATPLTPISVYEIEKRATFKEAFGSLNQEFDKLCFSQHQILNFVSRFKPWLSKGYPTFFPFTSHGKQFVVGIEMYQGGELYASLHLLEFGMVWGTTYKARIVVPRFESNQ